MKTAAPRVQVWVPAAHARRGCPPVPAARNGFGGLRRSPRVPADCPPVPAGNARQKCPRPLSIGGGQWGIE
jgi:hypothetical protein